jgi:hypothetical protein
MFLTRGQCEPKTEIVGGEAGAVSDSPGGGGLHWFERYPFVNFGEGQLRADFREW